MEWSFEEVFREKMGLKMKLERWEENLYNLKEWSQFFQGGQH